MHPIENQQPNRENPVPSRLEGKVTTGWPLATWGTQPILVGVSGGIDSVALLLILESIVQRHQLTNPLVVVHVNHGLRGKDSEADCHFVQGLAQSRNLNCETLNEPASPGGRSEEALREVRYQFFVEVASRWGARYIATGHQANDQIETFLFRLFRGTSLSGLTGIPTSRRLNEAVSVVRPLLNCWRQELQDYLAMRGQDFREDQSNSTHDFTRNRIRNNLLPNLIQEFGGQLPQRLLDVVAEVRDASELLQALTRAASVGVVDYRAESNSVFLEVGRFGSLPRLMQLRLLTDIWKTMGWPRNDLTRSDLEALRQCVLSSEPRRERHQFPGPILVTGDTTKKQLQFLG